MTTDEAKEKWCPMMQIDVAPHGDIITNRLENYNTVDCKADGCACWVWDRKTEHNYGPVKNLPAEQWQGHCGLAR